MAHNILLTGASGYLGGTVLARWKSANLPAYSQVYALVRSEEQGEMVRPYGAEPMIANLNDYDDLTEKIVARSISIIYFLVDAYTATHQPAMIRALGKVKQKTGREVNFLHTTGVKQFSRHAGMPTDGPLLDTNPHLYDLQKNAIAPHDFLNESVKANITVIDTAEAHGCGATYSLPALFMGEEKDLGKKLPFKTCLSSKLLRSFGESVRSTPTTRYEVCTWPVCHIADTAGLYLEILRKILSGVDIGYGKKGYFLAASGSIAWSDVYAAFAESLAKRDVVDDAMVVQADDSSLAQMGKVLGVKPSEVQVLLGGKCLFTAAHGMEIGWKPQYPPQHILDVVDEEVQLILRSLGENTDKANIR